MGTEETQKISKTFNLNLTEMGSHRNDLGQKNNSSDLHFKIITMAAVLEKRFETNNYQVLIPEV